MKRLTERWVTARAFVAKKKKGKYAQDAQLGKRMRDFQKMSVERVRRRIDLMGSGDSIAAES